MIEAKKVIDREDAGLRSHFEPWSATGSAPHCPPPTCRPSQTTALCNTGVTNDEMSQEDCANSNWLETMAPGKDPHHEGPLMEEEFSQTTVFSKAGIPCALRFR